MPTGTNKGQPPFRKKVKDFYEAIAAFTGVIAAICILAKLLGAESSPTVIFVLLGICGVFSWFSSLIQPRVLVQGQATVRKTREW